MVLLVTPNALYSQQPNCQRHFTNFLLSPSVPKIQKMASDFPPARPAGNLNDLALVSSVVSNTDNITVRDELTFD